MDNDSGLDWWEILFRFGWVVLAVFGVLFGAMCAAGIFLITGER